MKLTFCDTCGCDSNTNVYVITPMHVIFDREDIDFYKYDKSECIVADLCESCFAKMNEKYESFNEKIFRLVSKEINHANNKILKGEK